MSSRSWMAVPALAAGVLMFAAPGAFAQERATIYDVVQEGLTADQAKRLNATLGVEGALQPDGSYIYASPEFAKVPQKTVATGKDESGRPTTSQALDTDALKRLRPLPDDDVLKRVPIFMDYVGVDGDVVSLKPTVAHTELDLADANGRPTASYKLDTSVSFEQTLGGLPLTGPGAKLRAAYGPDGKLTQLTSANRRLKPGATVAIIAVDEAAKGCAALYGDKVRQGTPTLGYHAPALGSAKQIFPVYTCNPVGGDEQQTNLLLPAVKGSAPTATFEAKLGDGSVRGVASATGGTAPYRFKWSSSTTVIERNEGAAVDYVRDSRDKLVGEALTLTVTDANGLTSTATASFAGDGSVKGQSIPGGGGFGKLAIGPVDVGVEQTVDEWQCAQDSGFGFRNAMAARGVPTAFQFHGLSAWEEDFKKASAGGTDSSFTDNVDATWYTGHGGPNGFTFKNTTHDDNRITPADADWGNGDLEWLQLESCQVLRDTNGSMDQLARWGGAINGLHMMNGFHTNAICVDGGTGRTFAQLLFPQLGLPAFPVRNAWALMAQIKEPSGIRYRSIGNVGAGGVTNIGDYFWGQGPTGPDITKAARTGMWSLSGVS